MNPTKYEKPKTTKPPVILFPRKLFVMDIETKPQDDLVETFPIKGRANLKDPEKIKLDIEEKEKGRHKKMSTDPDYADIICIGIKQVGEEGKLYKLEDMEEWFKANSNFEFITYNGKKFDIPLLIFQGIKNKLNFPYRKLADMCKRWKINGHYDLMEIHSELSGEWKSKDLLCKIYLGETPYKVDYAISTDEEIGKRCLSDLKFQEELYNKFNVII